MPQAIGQKISDLKPIAWRYLLAGALVIAAVVIAAVSDHFATQDDNAGWVYGIGLSCAVLIPQGLKSVFEWKKHRARRAAASKIKGMWKRAHARRRARAEGILRKYFRVVKSNVKSIWEADTICFGEMHQSDPHAWLNAYLIDLLYRGRNDRKGDRGADRVLLEEGDSSWNEEARAGLLNRIDCNAIRFVQRPVEFAFWDEPGAKGGGAIMALEKELRAFHGEERQRISPERARELLDSYRRYLPVEDRTFLFKMIEEMGYTQAGIEQVPTEEVDLSSHPDFNLFLAGFITPVFQAILKEEVDSIQETWQARQDSLCEVIEEEADLRDGRTFVLYGSKHGNKEHCQTDTESEGVASFHHHLKANCRFILLEPRTDLPLPDYLKRPVYRDAVKSNTSRKATMRLNELRKGLARSYKHYLDLKRQFRP